jgi:hypothetical protein
MMERRCGIGLSHQNQDLRRSTVTSGLVPIFNPPLNAPPNGVTHVPNLLKALFYRPCKAGWVVKFPLYLLSDA